MLQKTSFFSFLILLNIYSCRSTSAQTNKMDSLRQILQTAKEDTNKVNTLNTLAWEIKSSKPDTAILLSSQALTCSEKAIWKKGIANSLRNLGIFNKMKGNNPLAVSYYNRALIIFQTLNDKNGISATLGNIGNVDLNQGDYSSALEHYLKALEIATELRNKSEMSKHLGNIGNIFRNLGDYPKALEHYFKALEIAEELRDKSKITVIEGNVGNVYKDQGDYSKALEYYFKALEIAKDLGNKRIMIVWLGDIGSLYTEQKLYKKAEDYLNKSLSIAEEIGSIDEIKTAHHNLSELYFWAPIHSTTAGRNIGTQNGIYALAVEHYEKYLQAKDTLFNEAKSESIGKMEGRHEFALLEMERERVEKEEAAAVAVAVKRRNTVQYSVIVMVIILFVSLVLVFSRLKIPSKIKVASVFITFLLLFEFILVIADPFIEKITGGSPVLKLAINGVLALLIFPIQNWLENKLSVGKIHPVAINVQNSSGKMIALFFCIYSLVNFSAFVPLWQEIHSHQNTKTPNPTKNGTFEHSNNRTIEHSNNTKPDSLRTLLFAYQNQITELRSQNKQKVAYETLKKSGDIKDSLQQYEKTQEFSRINAKHALEIKQAEKKVKAEAMKKSEAIAKVRKNNLQYSGIFIFITLLFILLIVFNRKSKIVNRKFLEGALFVSFLLLFEFIVVLADPYIEQYTSGAPAWKLEFNMVMAILIFPVHHFLEEKMRVKLFSLKNNKNIINIPIT